MREKKSVLPVKMKEVKIATDIYFTVVFKLNTK